MEDCIQKNRKANLKNCTCTYPCDKKGNCCACVAYHRNMNQLPGCFFSPEAEATYDRSYRNFIATTRV